MEDLEQLKVLESGYRMRVVVVEDASGAHGVDLPEDVASIEEIMARHGAARHGAAPPAVAAA